MDLAVRGNTQGAIENGRIRPVGPGRRPWRERGKWCWWSAEQGGRGSGMQRYAPFDMYFDTYNPVSPYGARPWPSNLLH